MKNTKINKKKEILRLLKDIKFDDQQRVESFINALMTETEGYDTNIITKESIVISEFTDVYLKSYEKNGILGEELKIFHLKSVKTESYDTEYTRLYRCDGERISFMGNMFNYNNQHHKLMSEKALRDCQRITKDEYDEYKQKYDTLKDMMGEILNEFGITK